MILKEPKLEAKIILIVLVTLFLSLGTILYFTIQKEKSNRISNYKNKIDLLGESVITSLQNIMTTGNALIAQQFVEDLKNIRHLESLEIIKINGLAAYRDLLTIEGVNARLGKEQFNRKHKDVSIR